MNPITLLIDHFMLPFIQFSYANIWPNFAISIALLTLLVKILLFPLTQKQFQSLKQMQVLQPKFKEMKDKYKDNPRKMQEETMKLYKETGINPLGGCLPMLLQLPFLLAIFYATKSDKFVEIITKDGVFPGFSEAWLPNLSQPDALYILPILIGLLTYLGQKFTPSSSANKQQQQIMLILPFFLIAICLKMPAGVLIYWAVSQLFSTVQQVIVMKETKGAN